MNKIEKTTTFIIAIGAVVGAVLAPAASLGLSIIAVGAFGLLGYSSYANSKSYSKEIKSLKSKAVKSEDDIIQFKSKVATLQDTCDFFGDKFNHQSKILEIALTNSNTIINESDRLLLRKKFAK